MAAALGHISYYVFYSLVTMELFIVHGSSSDLPCSQNCTCTSDATDCSHRKLTDIPKDLPDRTVYLNLSHNMLTAVDTDILSNLPNLKEVRLDHNELTSIPEFGSAPPAIVTLHLHHNKISGVQGSRLRNLTHLETLDLSNNDIIDVREHCFPRGLRVRDLSLSSNKIVHLEFGAFRNLNDTLQVLRLSRNRLTQLPVKGLELPRLTQLDLSRNRLRLIEGLTFQGLSILEVLKLQRNNISKLTDGAFFGLARMRTLHLEYNSLKEVNSGSLYGLQSLLHLHLSNNSISSFNPEGWRFCERLRELHLDHNNLTKLAEGSFVKLANLQTLQLSHNSINYIAEGAFKGLSSLRLLDLDHNDISGTIEDTSGAFAGLKKLRKLTLFGNRIKSVAKKAFSGLEALEHLNLGGNAILFILPDAFNNMKNLRSLEIFSDSFLCDCQLHWFPEWVVARELQSGIHAMCAHPESLKGTSIFQAPAQSFVCDDLPKPQITVHPSATAGVLGKDVRLTCMAVSSSSSPMTFTWRKDQEPLPHAHVENSAHSTSKDGPGIMEYTTVLHLRNVKFEDEGRYQCVISNHFGSTYSNKARLSISVLPSFVKTPRDLTIRAGAKARLECAAKGYPPPQVAWQKDGGTDFPAARERRMEVMPDDDVFFIMHVKPEDMGVYSCTARNTAGMISANVTITVLEMPHLLQGMEDRSVVLGEAVALQCKAMGSPPPRITWLHGGEPLHPSERHHFTHANQLLVISSSMLEDAGRYTCVMSNPLGTERAQCSLTVNQRPGGNCHMNGSSGAVTVGIVVIAVVTSVVATSLVWVCIIYQTRKKSEECSVNTDETIVPPDVPSYLSSQGTLSERQDICIRVESGGGSQPSGHTHNNGGFDVPVLCTDCMENGNSYSRPPDYFCHGITPPSGMEYQQMQPPSTFSSLKTGEGHCNGMPNGVRKEATPTLHKKNCDRKGSVSSRTGTSSPSESHHRPVKPTSIPSTCTDAELTQTLLPNGHTHLSETAPLRRASD
ncbi:leucine-rich repeats and immunoglobulin-like domains protein 1 isoform X1 [Tachysurus fulvidraco]|uniref:leucine-rich repeats and immunoglobulin-like domains protein 1 isoform X1 n=1 Tax=Tachysurus fulvidraco TaxID=1234273 RepID=UPI001FEF49B0|nr:leucine-rich repeats and immunoglobulin-like domains protein 1 isoform X1 [Tachysurus fulvidraco]XP_027011645.2 leucine-rich repeats and immunoglobulin-like domains protein 1 isoform X1 [Tachysurus fulvidraco]